MVTGLIEKIESLEWASKRGDAVSAAKSFGLPDATEELWRYTDFEGVAFDALQLASEKPAVVEASSDLVVVDGWLISETEQGSGFSVQLQEPEGPNLDFFSATSVALCPHQIQIDITDSADVSVSVITTEGIVSAPQIQINVADGVVASVSIAVESAADAMCLPRVVMSAGARANGNVAIASQGKGSSIVGQIHVTAESQAMGVVEVVGGDTELSRFATVAHLSGRGASLKMVSPSYLTGTQSSDHRVLVHHEAKDTTSDLLFRNVIDGQSKSIYSGVVKIHESGAGTNAVQENRTLSLSDDAWAHSVPNLEIENNEVACSHASTVSPVDYDQQFYLQSRGLSPEVADEAIVRGFLADVISKLSNPMAQSRVQEIVDHQLGGQG